MPFTTGLISSPAPATGFLYGTVVTPDWANLISGNINFFYGAVGNGTLSAYSLTLDGVGNQAVTGVAGGLKLSAAGTGTTTPTPTPVASTMYKDLIPLAYGRFAGASGSMTRGFNVSTITRGSAGSYTVTLINSATTGSDMIVVASPNRSTAAVFTAQVNVTGANAFDVYTFVAGVATDPTAVSFVVFGI
jgi:hypothetical protein